MGMTDCAPLNIPMMANTFSKLGAMNSIYCDKKHSAMYPSVDNYWLLLHQVTAIRQRDCYWITCVTQGPESFSIKAKPTLNKCPLLQWACFQMITLTMLQNAVAGGPDLPLLPTRLGWCMQVRNICSQQITKLQVIWENLYEIMFQRSHLSLDRLPERLWA